MPDHLAGCSLADLPAHGNARNDVDEQLKGSEEIAISAQKNVFIGALFVCLLSAFCIPAYAHIGPPFPIIENQRVGPVMIALWTHPDIGQSLFYVVVDPVPGSMIPKDLKVKIGVQPESGRLPETFFKADRDDTRNLVEYRTYANFDRDEFWRIHLVIESSAGNGEAFSRVEATPTLMGRFGLVFFSLPFVAIGYLWYRGISKKREKMRKRRQAMQARQIQP